MEQYCPYCVKQLSPQSKKMGAITKWMICPECGNRERPMIEDSTEAQKFIARRKQRNKNLNQFNQDS